MLRILFFHQDGQITGSAISMLNLIRHLDRTDFIISIAVGADGPLVEFLRAEGFQPDIVPIRKFVGVPPKSMFTRTFYSNLFSLQRNRRLGGYLKSQGPDILHINDKSALQAGMEAKKLGIPVVWHLRSTYAGSASCLQYWVSKTIIRRCSNYLISISEDETDGFDDLPHLSVVYNSLDSQLAGTIRNSESVFRKKMGVLDGQLAIGMVGNLSLRKGLYTFLKAVQILAESGDLPEACRFFVIADIKKAPYGGWRKRLGLPVPPSGYEKAQRICRKLGISTRIEFTGRQSNILDVMRGLDIVCACYHLWAIGRPGFESQAVGTPVIVNAGHTGKSKVVENEKTGMVVGRNDEKALALAISRLIHESQLRNRLIENGLINVKENFDARRNAEKVSEIYRKVANGM